MVTVGPSPGRSDGRLWEELREARQPERGRLAERAGLHTGPLLPLRRDEVS